MARKGNNYFSLIQEQVAFCCQAAKYLEEAVQGDIQDGMAEQREKMHTIEHGADGKKHDIMQRLAKEFITPIEREDIFSIVQAIDDITDSIEDVLIRMDLYGISALTPEMETFLQLVISCCDCLYDICTQFEQFRKATEQIHERIVRLNHLEEDGDALHFRAVYALLRSPKPPLSILAEKAIYDQMEECCDACEHVSDVIELVILKNT